METTTVTNHITPEDLGIIKGIIDEFETHGNSSRVAQLHKLYDEVLLLTDEKRVLTRLANLN